MKRKEPIKFSCPICGDEVVGWSSKKRACGASCRRKLLLSQRGEWPPASRKSCPICLQMFSPDPDKQKQLYCSKRCANTKSTLVFKFKISIEKYHELRERAQGRCEICGTDKPAKGKRFKEFCIDHDHSTGRVRGMICNECNKGLGNFGDDPERLRKAASYLEKNA